LCRQLTPLAICSTVANGNDSERTKINLRFIQKVLETLSSNRQNLIHWDREGRVIQQYLKEILSQENGLSSNGENVLLNDIISVSNRVNELEKYQEEEPFPVIFKNKEKPLISLIANDG